MTKFLIVDDHELMRSALSELLSLKAGWNVCAAVGNGWEALEAVCRHHPDAAVVDVGLAGLDGLEVTRRIRLESPQTGVVVYTGGDVQHIRASAAEVGAAAVVQKGEPASRLLEELENVVASRASAPRALAWRAAPREAAPTLTPREVEILTFLAEGKSNWSTGVILGISERTVETHRNNIMGKLSLASVVELVHFAIRNGLVVP